VKRYFAWLETKSYKMHIACCFEVSHLRSLQSLRGARLKPEALLWRLPSKEGIVGLTIHDVWCCCQLIVLPRVFNEIKLPAPLDEASDLLLTEIRTRLRYLVDVGLGYLTLDRQSRTLSGGESSVSISLRRWAPRWSIRSTWLDEPSIACIARHQPSSSAFFTGSAPREIRCSSSSTIRMSSARRDRVLDLGPGPGERGGEMVFFGTQAN